jgi:hypothetical protein
MSDGTKGIPEWQEALREYMSSDDANKITRERFSWLYDLIRSAQQVSDLQKLLEAVPVTRKVQ